MSSDGDEQDVQVLLGRREGEDEQREKEEVQEGFHAVE